MPSRIARTALACLWVAVFILIAPLAHSGAHGGASEVTGVTELELLHQFDPETGERIIPNERCLVCHADEDHQYDVRDDGSPVYIYVEQERIEASVHGELRCTDCHTTIDRVPHREAPHVVVGCVECHRQMWDEHKDDPDGKFERLAVVNEQIDNFLHSVHARPSRLDESRTNATCYDCHDAHSVGPLGSIQRAEQRLNNPLICGDCHEGALADYRDSVHGRAVLEERDSEAAVCSDCHTTHEIDSPAGDPVMLTITENCGDCHQDSARTYRASYHGQVATLGYTNTAKCFDCHGGHRIHGEDDPVSMVHRENRLATCSQCHDDAPAGFLGFHAHGDPTDFANYPGLWITATFMHALIIIVLAFFWTHVIFWLYREYQDRKAGKSYHHPAPGEDTVYVRRFSATWRWLHLLFAVSTMALVLTGTTLLFAHTGWAKAVMALLGGPENQAIVHRAAAIIWLGVFFTHLAIVIRNIARNPDFHWFGPNSMLPNLQDLGDVKAMFAWFFGRRERPEFDRFAYWQKFDYWAPFWGVAVIGISGAILFNPTATGAVMPGWIFNVATIIHAEEALLAVVFIFTVHFFNSHFRPDRFPMSTIMFTGVVPLEEFKFEHRLEYERLKASGELEKRLIRHPSSALEKGSRALSAVLILAGLGLLTLVLIGYLTMPY